MAVYVYDTTTGELASWCPNDTDPVASSTELAAKGLASVSGLPPLDASHEWDATNKTVKTVTPPTPPQPIDTGAWILRFTATEFQAIRASTDPEVEHWLYALDHTQRIDLTDTTIVNGVDYLVSINLLAQSRVAAIMAAP